MGEMIHMPWLARRLTVTDSTDPTLVGVSGVVHDETRRTIRIMSAKGAMTLAKDSIHFKIENEEIDGSLVKQRPEDRISKRHRGGLS
ncbi:MAG TPA: ribonuclease P protein subunit [Candidatus Thalassarchaeaceae archaeon]|nr:ribonuclease P protein subunit [Candidatus Thalassarchaeaceae archaeon]|tara:strand:- start:1159 stop:1419 length:261 start_codon:yes stop_codon:yes gene_type:complete